MQPLLAKISVIKSQDSAQSTADKVKGKVNRDMGRTQQAIEDAID